MLKISKKLEWLRPYINESAKDGINLSRILDVVGYKTPDTRIQRQLGSTAYMYKRGTKRTKFRISMLTHYQYIEHKRKPKSKIEIRVGYAEAEDGYGYERTLMTLAHELAHTKHWDHTPAHMELTGKIFYRFARMAKKFGYKGHGIKGVK